MVQDPDPGSTRRIRLARVVAGFFCLVALVPMYGLIDLGTLLGWANPDYVWAVPLESSWGELFTFSIGSALGWIALWPARSRTALVQLATVTGAVLLCALVWWEQGPWWVGLTVGVVTAALAWLLRGHLVPAPVSATAWPRLVWALLGVVLWAPAAWGAFQHSLSVAPEELEITNDVDHWPIHAAVALLLILLPFRLVRRRESERLVLLSVGLSASWIGMAMLVFPDRARAVLSTAAGAAMVLWVLAGALLKR